MACLHQSFKNYTNSCESGKLENYLVTFNNALVAFSKAIYANDMLSNQSISCQCGNRVLTLNSCAKC